MKNRDRTYKKTDHHGQLTEVSKMDCPCKPCYKIHYFAELNKYCCLTRELKGCPDNKQYPNHLIKKDNPEKRTEETMKKCLRCGEYFTLHLSSFMMKEEYKKGEKE